MKCSDWINLIGVIVSVCVVIVSMFVTNYNTDKQIKNQKKNYIDLD